MPGKGWTSKSAWRHFNERIFQRYNFVIPHEEWKALPDLITSGKGFIGRISLTKTWWLLDTSKGKVLAFYNSDKRFFFTVMPLEFLESAIEKDGRARKYLGLTDINPKVMKWYDEREPERLKRKARKAKTIKGRERVSREVAARKAVADDLARVLRASDEKSPNDVNIDYRWGSLLSHLYERNQAQIH